MKKHSPYFYEPFKKQNFNIFIISVVITTDKSLWDILYIYKKCKWDFK